jgi:hypothetical protein
MIAYRRHAEWKQIVKLIPWAGLGVIGGFFVLGAIDNVQARLLIGISLVIMIILHVTNDGKSAVVGGGLSTPLMAPIIGAMAGFVSMIANAAGPLMMLYLLAMRMPKMAFMGTSVYFFTLLNLFKVPFLAYLDIVTLESIGANLRLIPLVIGGAFIGYAFARRVNQLWFERTAFWLTIIAVAYMIWNAAKEVINAYG